jgi:hypothetical protein
VKRLVWIVALATSGMLASPAAAQSLSDQICSGAPIVSPEGIEMTVSGGTCLGDPSSGFRYVTSAPGCEFLPPMVPPGTSADFCNEGPLCTGCGSGAITVHFSEPVRLISMGFGTSGAFRLDCTGVGGICQSYGATGRIHANGGRTSLGGILNWEGVSTASVTQFNASNGLYQFQLDSVTFARSSTCDPANTADFDGDALLDEWETCGLDIAPDGTISVCEQPPCDLDLPAMGADPFQRDLFVEIDWMRKGPHQKAHYPRRRAINRIVAAFQGRGIRLHIDAGPGSVMNPDTGATWGALSRSASVPHVARLGTCGADVTPACEASIWTGSGPGVVSFDDIKTANFEALRGPVFRYGLLAHGIHLPPSSQFGISGVARGAPAQDFIVSLGDWNPSGGGTPKQLGGTIMHELGHTLGLDHGGLGDPTGWKPNYLSVMNYHYQTTGLIAGGVPGLFDYSFLALPNLDENLLDEDLGLTGGLAAVSAQLAGYGTKWWCGGFCQSGPVCSADSQCAPGLCVGLLAVNSTSDATAPIDWDCDGNPGGFSTADINTPRSEPPALKVLDGSVTNDWANLDFAGGSIGSLGVSPPPAVGGGFVELTAEGAALGRLPLDLVVEAPVDVGVDAGATHIHEFEITNVGTLPDTYQLAVFSSEGWAQLGTVPFLLGPLAPDETASVSIEVRVPDQAHSDGGDALRLIATSSVDSNLSDEDTTVTVALADLDGDTVSNPVDNCLALANPGQQDRDGDYFGNACDCDFDGDGVCGIADFNLFLPDFMSATDAGTGTDMDADGVVGIGDFNLFLPGFISGAPGPSGFLP